MNDADKRAGNRVFIVRPWHDPTTSLYPLTMDGVEYVDMVIRTIRTAFPSEEYDVRVDEDVFIPGQTLRENVEREIMNAELVLVILDGLRPNVIYELGLARGMQSEFGDTGEANSRRVICLAEINATVLVRNYYPFPMKAPTVTGELVTVINPKLDMARAFSDNADLLLLRYDRLNLDGTLIKSLVRWRDDRKQETKQAILSELPKDSIEPPPPAAPPAAGETAQAVAPVERALQTLWEFYNNGQYEKVIQIVDSPLNVNEKKILALCLMKASKIYESLRLWKELLSVQNERAGALFHLGICSYVVGQLEAAAYYFKSAEEAKYPRDDYLKQWIDRVSRHLSTDSVASEAGEPSK